jgi:hypothetical protein
VAAYLGKNVSPAEFEAVKAWAASQGQSMSTVQMVKVASQYMPVTKVMLLAAELNRYYPALGLKSVVSQALRA